MTRNEWVSNVLNINDTNQRSFHVKCEDYFWPKWPEVSIILLKPRKSIFARFYENCRNKSENLCVSCFNRVVEYCKD